jgi:hypothetical protein
MINALTCIDNGSRDVRFLAKAKMSGLKGHFGEGLQALAGLDPPARVLHGGSRGGWPR